MGIILYDNKIFENRFSIVDVDLEIVLYRVATVCELQASCESKCEVLYKYERIEIILKRNLEYNRSFSRQDKAPQK